jgi:hypothetical protein
MCDKRKTGGHLFRQEGLLTVFVSPSPLEGGGRLGADAGRVCRNSGCDCSAPTWTGPRNLSQRRTDKLTLPDSKLLAPPGCCVFSLVLACVLLCFSLGQRARALIAFTSSSDARTPNATLTRIARGALSSLVWTCTGIG